MGRVDCNLPLKLCMRSCDKSCASHTSAYNWLAISTKTESFTLAQLCIHFFLHLNIHLIRTFTGQKPLPGRAFCTLILPIKADIDLLDNGAWYYLVNRALKQSRYKDLIYVGALPLFCNCYSSKWSKVKFWLVWWKKRYQCNLLLQTKSGWSFSPFIWFDTHKQQISLSVLLGKLLD